VTDEARQDDAAVAFALIEKLVSGPGLAPWVTFNPDTNELVLDGRWNLTPAEAELVFRWVRRR
jgi:hypothetical protein